MRLTNKTVFDDDLIREAIRFVKPVDVTGFDVLVKHKKHSFHGRAYPIGRLSTGTASITVAICPSNKYPFTRNAFGAYLKVVLYSATELLVYTLAHELRHLWQGLHRKGWRVYGAKGQYSERDADAYAIHMLREWRRK